MNRSCQSLVCAVVLGLCVAMVASPAQADDLFPDHIQTGGFFGDYLPGDFPPPPPAIPPVPPPDNSPTFQNYFMGRTSIGPDTFPERRVFFLFDGSSVDLPAGHSVTGVTIDLKLLFGGVLANFAAGPEAPEVVVFSSTPFSEDAILDPAGEGEDPLAIWSTFGEGTLYGDFPIFGAGATEPTIDGDKTIGLPGAIMDVQDAIEADATIIVTARLESFDPGPIDTPGVSFATDPYEFVFGLSDVVPMGGTVESGIGEPILTVTTAIPEPASLALLGFGGLALLRRRA